MAEFAALPIFTDAIIADTQHLDDAEFGRYVRLLIVTWRSPRCEIPNDKAWIAKRLRLDPLQYDGMIWPIIREFFSGVDNSGEIVPISGNANAYATITQKRLKKEWNYTFAKREAARQNAKSRWEKEKVPWERISKTPKSAYAPTPSPTPHKINPPTPQSPENQKSEGFKKLGQGRGFNNFGKGGEKGTVYDIQGRLSDDDLLKARQNAPGWDIYHLMRVYDQGIADGTRTPPDRPGLAFAAWCAKYTKGKAP